MYASFQSGESWTQREMRRKAVPRDAFFKVRSNSQEIRPMSVATEFVDTDWEEDDDMESEAEENSPRASLQSAGQPSFTTVSSYDEAPTPTSSRAREMYNEDHAKQVEGPRGPHLFYSFADAFLAPHEYDEEEVTLALSPITPKVPRGAADMMVVQPQQPRRGSPFQYTDEELDISLLRTWTPEMVAQSMLSAGMDMSVTDRLMENDINGEILITLKFEDLRELDIPSFGIRTRVWNQIQALRESQAQPASPRPPTPIEDAPSREARREVRWRERKEGDAPLCTTRQDSRRQRRRPSGHDVITPMESVSIIGIEQVLPKPHSCSKGENCSKWKKQQQMMEELRAVNPHVDFNSGAVIMYGDAGNPDTARALDPHEVMMLRPFSDAMPSVVASSDVLGPGISPPVQNVQESAFGKFHQAQDHQHQRHLPHDAQESIRQFLSFQDQQKGDEMPPTPPFEVAPLGAQQQQQQQQQPHQGLRHLPKLCIPERGQVQVPAHTQTSRPAVPPPSKQSLSQQQQQHQTHQPQQRHHFSPSQQEFVPYRMERANPLSPDLDATATRNPYRFGTPFSEMDVPITTMTLGPVSRDVSQSVPPDMNYRAPLASNGINGSIGDHHHPPPHHRQQDTNGHHRSQSRASGRRPSFVVLPSLNEDQTANVSPGTTSPKILPHRPREAAPPAPSHAPPRFHYPWSPKRNTFEQALPASSTRRSSDAQAHAQAHAQAQAQAQAQETRPPAAAAAGVSFQGPMKKRKTRMLRHEWQDGYFTLKGTRLNMHKDAQQMDRTLEYVDIDDYAIACSGAASTSKLSAAFKAVSMSSHDRKRSDPVGAFSFQLIPQDKNSSTGSTSTNTSAGARFRRRESSVSGPSDGEGVNGTGKTHHFAVKGRDERIDWMRELMLAKALKQKGQGFEISVNGNMI